MSTVSLSPEPVLAVGYIGAGARSESRRRRTVSTSFEQSGAINKRLLGVGGGERRTVSVAANLTSIPALSEDNDLEEKVNTIEKLGLAQRIPCLGILLVISATLLFQGGFVIAKKMTLHPMMMLFYRDIFQLSWTTPAVIAGGDNPFPRGKVILVMARGLAAGCLLTSSFYGVRYLPLSDVTMIAAIKPASTAVLSWIFLKEACGVFEILNLILVTGGIFLVVQPSFVFGDMGTEYTSHMMYTALGVFVANTMGGMISVIIRYLRSMHWAALAVTTRLFTLVELTVVVSILGLFCLPECGMDRWGTIALAVIGSLVQAFFIFALKCEEAHVVGLTDNASSIIVAFLFQIIFFQDYPNTLKIIGTCIVMLSIILLGGHKIWKHQKGKPLNK